MGEQVEHFSALDQSRDSSKMMQIRSILNDPKLEFEENIRHEMVTTVEKLSLEQIKLLEQMDVQMESDALHNVILSFPRHKQWMKNSQILYGLFVVCLAGTVAQMGYYAYLHFMYTT